MITLAGAVLRIWNLPRLGLSHFDEGIYALAGLWSVSPGNLASLDRSLIPYAPPGYPILVGLGYLGLGVSDLAPLLVSILAGTLTIPVTAWLARRTCGAGAGAAAACLLAFSGYHVAFSRLALTDASLLLCWVLGLVCAQRFLERPRVSTAIALGLSVGLAQWFKYNGWLLGAFVALAAGLGILVDPSQREARKILATWGYGAVAAIITASVYWPWFAYVDSHGGYSGLMRHHQSYVGGFDSWLPHIRIQLDQVAALSGGPVWNAMEYLAAVLACELVLLGQPRTNRLRMLVVMAVLGLVVCVFPAFYGLLGAGWAFDHGRGRGPARRLLAAAWLGLMILTPFYHPYARLWLPLHFLGWIMAANIIRQGSQVTQQSPVKTPSAQGTVGSFKLLRGMLIASLAVFLAFVVLGSSGFHSPTMGPGSLPGPLAPSDSLRSAVRKALADLPAGTPALRLLARPPVTFYLAGRVAVQVEPDLAHLLVPGANPIWALVDLAQLRQEGDLKAATSAIVGRWEIVREYPSQPSLPALLDMDPAAARAGTSESMQAPLWLLRPRTAQGPAR